MTLSDGQGNTVLDVVTGEARVTANGDVCSKTGSGGGGKGVEGTGGADSQPCPDGSSSPAAAARS